jgi:outer membrane receptor protein involved in Fe transport
VPDPPAADARPELNELVVTASQYELTRGPAPPAAVMSAAALDFIPNPGDDPLRAAARLPGTAGADYTAKSNIRGGEVDEMLVRFDGLRLYNPFHLKDFQSIFSAIDPGITRQMNVYTGGFPSHYGDRMSSVIDIASLPAGERPYREVSLSFFNAAALATGGFDGGRGDWLLSARRGNLDLLFDVISSDLGEPSFLDVYARAGHRFRDAFGVTANFLLFDDDIVLFESGQKEESARADYRDVYGWLRFDIAPREDFGGYLIVAHTELDSRRAGRTVQPGVATGTLADARGFSIDSLQVDWSWRVGERVDLRFGGHVNVADGDYRYTDEAEFALLFLTPGATSESGRTTDLARNVDGEYYGVYLNARCELTAALVAEAGIRWDKETVSPARASDLSPRLALLWAMGDRTDLRASWGRYYQAEAINELQISDGVTAFAPPQRSDHFVLGLDHRFARGIDLRVEAYHKRYDRLRARHENFLNPLVLLPELKPDRVRIAPDDSKAKGVEATLRYAGDSPWSGWVTYAWASVKDDVMNAKVRRAWDQTHSLRAGLGWRGERWEFSAVGSWHTGWPTTQVELATSAPVPLVATGPRNALRLGAFHSIDLRAARTWRFGESQSLSVFVEFANVFNVSNDCCVEYEVDDETGALELETEAVDGLPFIPSAGFVWRF